MRLLTLAVFMLIGGTGFALVSPKYVVSLAQTPDGVVWAGTDGDGLWRSSDGARTWERDTSFNDKCGDCAFCLTVDSFGRLWSGSLSNGVCVFNGTDWAVYAPEEGFRGSRVFSITSDLNGNVWIASDGGLANYSESDRKWRFFSRADGLLENEIMALDVSPRVGLAIGYSTRGVSTGRSSGQFKPMCLDQNPSAIVGQVNCLYWHKTGALMVGTKYGCSIVRKSAGQWKCDSLLEGSGICKKKASTKDPRKPIVVRDAYVSAICDYDDSVMVAFRSGELLVYDLKARVWRNLAEDTPKFDYEAKRRAGFREAYLYHCCCESKYGRNPVRISKETVYDELQNEAEDSEDGD